MTPSHPCPREVGVSSLLQSQLPQAWHRLRPQHFLNKRYLATEPDTSSHSV